MFRRIRVTALTVAFIVSPLALASRATSVAEARPRGNSLTTHEQEGDAQPRATVTLALQEAFSNPSLGAVIRRRPGTTADELIALRRDALTPELLSAAWTTLHKSRTRHGDTPQRAILVRIPKTARSGSLSTAERARFTAIIEQLTNAPLQDLGELGLVPAITISFVN